MESKLSPDKDKKSPTVPIKTYRWEDLRRARDAGGYPWTHLSKKSLEYTSTYDSLNDQNFKIMPRELSRSCTRSPIEQDRQQILNLDSSPGSSRKYGEKGTDEGVHIPNFSKEETFDSKDSAITQAIKNFVAKGSKTTSSFPSVTSVEIPNNVSPKSTVIRRTPDQQFISFVETREKTKCCHPLVNKIKHLADKIHPIERTENDKSNTAKLKKNKDQQEIRQLKSSPSAVRRQKFSVIKLGDSDEMSKTIKETPSPIKRKKHIYEAIVVKDQEISQSLQFSADVDEQNAVNDKNKSYNNMDTESLGENKTLASQDPCLVVDDIISLKQDDHVMEILHRIDDMNKEASVLDEQNLVEVFQNQFGEFLLKEDSPNMTITETTHSQPDIVEGHPTISIQKSPSSNPRELISSEWSEPNSDHEYEVIEKSPPNILYNIQTVRKSSSMDKTNDELSNTTLLERNYFQCALDEEEENDKKNIDKDSSDGIMEAEALQKIEKRYFVKTPSTISRTECETSSSQVNSSALENLPLKRENRSKNIENCDSKLHQRIKEGTGKLKSQAGKLKTKILNIKTLQFTLPKKAKINLSSRPRFKMPDCSKIYNMTDRRNMFSLDNRKFSLPDHSKFKKINISEKINLSDRKKFALPVKPKFKMPDRSKFYFPSLVKKNEYKVETDRTGSNFRNVTTVNFETVTYPRLFKRKKETEIPKTSSSPTLNREETPSPKFTFSPVKKTKFDSYSLQRSEESQEYANIDHDMKEEKRLEIRYDLYNMDTDYVDETEKIQESKNVMNEINVDEFFIRPRGLSRENIEVREYLSNEILQAFKIPKNDLRSIGSNFKAYDETLHFNEPNIDPQLISDENEHVQYTRSIDDFNHKDKECNTNIPLRPFRTKNKNKEPEPAESIEYIDESVNASKRFGLVDLRLTEDQDTNIVITNDKFGSSEPDWLEYLPSTDLHSVYQYSNYDVVEYPKNIHNKFPTLPLPPKRKKKLEKPDFKLSSLTDLRDLEDSTFWQSPDSADDIIVFRTEHDYVVPRDVTVEDENPVPPRRNRSRSSRGTSFCDDDRTSQGAESLTLDSHLLPTDDIKTESEICRDNPGYAIVHKGQFTPSKIIRQSKSKTPPARRSKSNSFERKYYTVGSSKPTMPDRPPRKKSSTSLVTLNSYSKNSLCVDLTQYVEIDNSGEVHKDLNSGEILNKMKNRPLPPPPRPPRGCKKDKNNKFDVNHKSRLESDTAAEEYCDFTQILPGKIIEIEVSIQTDPIPDNVDFELGVDEKLPYSISSSLRDMVDEDSMIFKSQNHEAESLRFSRPTSSSEKSLKISNPKINELSKSSTGRISPTVILIEKRVSSPTHINEQKEILTEASLTVQHIDISESQIMEIPSLPEPIDTHTDTQVNKSTASPSKGRSLERVAETCSDRDVQLDNLVAQRLQVLDLEVGRLNVTELLANKILVSDIEGMTLHVTELDSKSGHISVSGIEFSQSVIDEIVKKIAEITTREGPTPQVHEICDYPTPDSRKEQTQTEEAKTKEEFQDNKTTTQLTSEEYIYSRLLPPSKEGGRGLSLPPQPPPLITDDDSAVPPQRPPLPDLTPLLCSYLKDITLPPATFYRSRTLRERPFTEFHESRRQSPPTATRRSKKKTVTPHSESSSDDGRLHPSPRRMNPPVQVHEPSITEAGAQFFRVCQNSMHRTMRKIFNCYLSYINGTEDRKEMKMALVIFLVLIAGLIIFGLGDSRAIHHHHWEFFNPPDTKQ